MSMRVCVSRYEDSWKDRAGIVIECPGAFLEIECIWVMILTEKIDRLCGLKAFLAKFTPGINDITRINLIE